MEKPSTRPQNPRFSCGPCTKRPGWSLEALSHALVGRSHRSAPAKAQLKQVIETHKEILGIPADYLVGIVPASDTGAMEMAMWSMLGARGVDLFAWENFSADWLKDVRDHLKLEDARIFEADYGQLPDLSMADPARDIIFPWNGTTSGVCVPNADWISAEREGLSICDATSAMFAYSMPWDKLDVTTWSWQKALGSEAAHGMIVLSPRAVERLESFEAPRALPKIFRMTKGGKLNAGIFEGVTINTPSMLAVADVLDALDWVKDIGGASATSARSQASLDAVTAWVEGSDWVEFLAKDETIRSRTSICLIIKDEWFQSLSEDEQASFMKGVLKTLDVDGVAYDINAYKTAPIGIRIWAGPTVEPSDVAALLPWLDWAYAEAKAKASQEERAAYSRS